MKHAGWSWKRPHLILSRIASMFELFFVAVMTRAGGG